MRDTTGAPTDFVAVDHRMALRLRDRRDCHDDGRRSVASGALSDATLEVEVRGPGEPVVLIQTALTADEFCLAGQPELQDNYRAILYHRRGYAGSSPVRGPGSIERDAHDCHQSLSPR